MRVYALFAFTKNFFYLFKSSYSVMEKLTIFYYYCAFTFLFLIMPVKLHYLFTKVSFLGYKVDVFNFFTFHYLFAEVFVRNDYGLHLDKHAVILDAGADFGMTTLFFKWRRPECTVHAFEPDPESFKLLQKNIQQNNLSNVYVYCAALDTKVGKTSFYKSAEEGSLLMSLDKNRISDTKIEVDTMDIAQVIKAKEITFMKMDVEGYETTLMPYLVSTDALKNIKELIIEYHHNVGESKPQLASFLSVIEGSGYDYQLDTYTLPLISKRKFQDMLIYAYK